MSRRQQKMILALLVALIGMFTASTAQKPPAQTTSQSTASTSPEIWYPVEKVVDGDTIDILADGKKVRVRLIGLDTPESVDPRRPVQCFGKEASDELRKILTGQSVRVETDPTQDTYDKYGRLLAYVYAPANSAQQGILVNKYMISEGYGHEYTYDRPYKYQKDFRAAETSARNSEKGLWAKGVCEN